MRIRTHRMENTQMTGLTELRPEHLRNHDFVVSLRQHSGPAIIRIAKKMGNPFRIRRGEDLISGHIQVVVNTKNISTTISKSTASLKRKLLTLITHSLDAIIRPLQ